MDFQGSEDGGEMTPIGKYEAQRVAQEKNLEDYRVARRRAEVAIARAKELKAAWEGSQGCHVGSPPHTLRWPPQWDGKNPAVNEIPLQYKGLVKKI